MLDFNLPFSIYTRITQDGTLSERNGVPDPSFALPSTANWMKSLATLARAQGFTFNRAVEAYEKVQRRKMSLHEENSLFEQMLFAIHQVSALEALINVPRKSDVARVGIVAWYYGVYAAASAMNIAADGSFQEDHMGTARVWDRQIASTNLALWPFSHRISSLIKVECEAKIVEYKKNSNGFNLNTDILKSEADAYTAAVSYLSGNALWWRNRSEEDIKNSKAFRELGVDNFRKKAARELRDKALMGKSICFLHQAFRYRGKANYRESLFLGYGPNVEIALATYLTDARDVLGAFVAMSGAYCKKRIGKDLWNKFVEDLERNRAFSKSLDTIFY